MFPHLGVEAIEGHDGPEEEERQVEVVLEQVSQGVAASRVGAVFQREAGATQHCETAAPLKQHLLKIKSACYKPVLDGREQAASSPGAPCLWEAHPVFPQGPLHLFQNQSTLAIQGQYMPSAGIKQRMSGTYPCCGAGDPLVGKAYSMVKGLEMAREVKARPGETWEVWSLDGMGGVELYPCTLHP